MMPLQFIKSAFRYIIFVLIIICIGCQSEKNEKSELIGEASSQSVIEIDSNIVKTESTNRFLQTAKHLQDSFPNYHQEYPQLIDTIINPYDHWFINIIERQRQAYKRSNQLRRLKQLPDSSNISEIKTIYRFALYQGYKHMDDLVVEQWLFNNKLNAEMWRDGLSNKLKNNIFTKPPREQWTNGDTLYLVATRSAQQWFAQNDQIISILTGKKRRQISFIFDPLDLKKFKKTSGAHSSPSNNHPYLYHPTNGYYYHYFFFTGQRLTGEERQRRSMEFRQKKEFRIVTFVKGEPTGVENYLTIKEKLVEIQSTVNDPNLGGLDIVGNNQVEVNELLGNILFEKDTTMIYGHADRIFVIKYSNEKVVGFKYMWLDQPFDQIMVTEPDLLKKLVAFTDD